MKRSDFVARLHYREDPWVTSIVELTEAAGVTWDPEEEPLPERLAYVQVELPLPERLAYVQVELIPGGGIRNLTAAEAHEVVRRWNVAWPALRVIADRLGGLSWGDDEDRDSIFRDLRAILDGGAE